MTSSKPAVAPTEDQQALFAFGNQRITACILGL